MYHATLEELENALVNPPRALLTKRELWSKPVMNHVMQQIELCDLATINDALVLLKDEYAHWSPTGNSIPFESLLYGAVPTSVTSEPGIGPSSPLPICRIDATSYVGVFVYAASHRPIMSAAIRYLLCRSPSGGFTSHLRSEFIYTLHRFDLNLIGYHSHENIATFQNLANHTVIPMFLIPLESPTSDEDIQAAFWIVARASHSNGWLTTPIKLDLLPYRECRLGDDAMETMLQTKEGCLPLHVAFVSASKRWAAWRSTKNMKQYEKLLKQILQYPGCILDAAASKMEDVHCLERAMIWSMQDIVTLSLPHYTEMAQSARYAQWAINILLFAVRFAPEATTQGILQLP